MMSDEEHEELETLLEADRIEAEAFMRQHGFATITETRDILSQAVEDGKLQELEDARAHLHTLDCAIRALPCIDRLRGLKQLGGKINPLHADYDPNQPFVVRPAFHTRYDHSELLAEQSLVAGVKLDLPLEDIMHLICAGWFHDVGHSAFSHCGDEFLVARGMPGHEERGEAILKSPEVREVLEKERISVDKVFDIIKERGLLGTLQKMFDTLSYLSLDSAMMHDPVYDDYGAKVIRDVVGAQDDVLVFSKLDNVQDMLEQRAQRYKDIYYHPVNKMVDESLRKLIWIAEKEGLFDVSVLETGTDHEVYSQLQYLAGGSPHTRRLKGCSDLFGMTFGTFNHETWKRIRFTPDQRSRIDEYLFRHRNDKQIMEQSFVAEPYDYTKKSLTVMTEDGEMHVLKARTVELREEDKCYLLFTPRV